MKVGDLVKYVSPGSRWDGAWTQPGIVLRCIPGTDECKVVRWVTGTTGSYPARNLEVVSSVLTDEQLENVVGGLSPQMFDIWRSEKLNESR